MNKIEQIVKQFGYSSIKEIEFDVASELIKTGRLISESWIRMDDGGFYIIKFVFNYIDGDYWLISRTNNLSFIALERYETREKAVKTLIEILKSGGDSD